MQTKNLWCGVCVAIALAFAPGEGRAETRVADRLGSVACVKGYDKRDAAEVRERIGQAFLILSRMDTLGSILRFDPPLVSRVQALAFDQEYEFWITALPALAVEEPQKLRPQSARFLRSILSLNFLRITDREYLPASYDPQDPNYAAIFVERGSLIHNQIMFALQKLSGCLVELGR